MMSVTFSSLLIWLADPPQRGRPATARQADDVPIAIGRSPGNAGIHHILSRFLSFTGPIVKTQIIFL
jgi:hypothetical protein